jgi:predicted RNase H-like HicB family nuclease
VRTETFWVHWSAEDQLWLVEHTDRDDVFTQAVTLEEARRFAVEVLALADEVDESEIGSVRFIVDGPVDTP